MRRVVQATNVRMEYIRKNKGEFDGPTVWLKSLGSFRKRLAWRCHFVQKLEMEDNLDLVAQNPVIDANLMRTLDEDRFTRWKNGTTGWPFLDACMRQLSSTGWINFRMRAMIMSAASYNYGYLGENLDVTWQGNFWIMNLEYIGRKLGCNPGLPG